MSLFDDAFVDTESGAIDGYVLRLDGNGDYGSADFSTYDNEISITARVYLDQSSHDGSERFICETFPDFRGGYMGLRGANALEGGDAGAQLAASSDFPLQQPVMVGLAIDDSDEAVLYQDGSRVDSDSNTTLTAENGLNFGTYRDGDARFWPGYIDAPIVWNRKLSDSGMSDVADYYGTT